MRLAKRLIDETGEEIGETGEKMDETGEEIDGTDEDWFRLVKRLID